MTTKCDHVRTKQDESSIRGYCCSVAVEPYTEPNPCAAGGVMYVEQCEDCGRERTMNLNGRHNEVSPWEKSRAQLAREESIKQQAARREREDAAVRARNVVIERIRERPGYLTSIDMQIDGRYATVLCHRIEDAVNQVDNGDGLVPFYRGLLRAVKAFRNAPPRPRRPAGNN